MNTDYKKQFEWAMKTLEGMHEIDQQSSALRQQMTNVIVKLMGQVREFKVLCDAASIDYTHIDPR